MEKKLIGMLYNGIPVHTGDQLLAGATILRENAKIVGEASGLRVQGTLSMVPLYVIADSILIAQDHFDELPSVWLRHDKGFSMMPDLLPCEPERSNTLVDEFIDYGTPSKRQDMSEQYARFVLHHMRLPAHLRSALQAFFRVPPLYARFAGHVYRVTGASRMGDIWLHSDLSAEYGYVRRIFPNSVEAWGLEPTLQPVLPETYDAVLLAAENRLPANIPSAAPAQ